MKQNKATTIEKYLDLNDTENFYDFSNGVPIADKEIKGRIIEIINHVIKLKFSTHYSIASGNTKVDVFYDAKEQRADITISKNYSEGHLYFKEDGILDTGGIPLKKDPTSNKWNLDFKLKWED